MAARRRNRQRRPGRRAPFREPKPVILIVCEGEKTEPQYLRGFERQCRNARLVIQIAPEHGIAPKALVDAAKRRKTEAARVANRQRDKNLEFDSVWCVFDIDDHSRVPDARQMARDNGIELAISNPCFELWLALHFRENPGVQRRQQIRQMLRTYVPEYDKHVDFATYVDGYSDAVIRATRMDEAAENDAEPGRNPTTGVY